MLCRALILSKLLPRLSEGILRDYQLFLVETEKLVSLPARSLHLSQLSFHGDELLSCVAGVTAIRNSDCRREGNHEFVPVASHLPRLFQSRRTHAYFVVCLSGCLCWLSVCALFWIIVYGPNVNLIVGLILVVMLSALIFHLSLDHLDRIELGDETHETTRIQGRPGSTWELRTGDESAVQGSQSRNCTAKEAREGRFF